MYLRASVGLYQCALVYMYTCTCVCVCVSQIAGQRAEMARVEAERSAMSKLDKIRLDQVIHTHTHAHTDTDTDTHKVLAPPIPAGPSVF